MFLQFGNENSSAVQVSNLQNKKQKGNVDPTELLTPDAK
jgi:hypothetical protein